MTSQPEKRILWLGSTLEDMRGLPQVARQRMGYQLHRVQNGREPHSWRPMTSVGKGVREIRVSDAGRTFRTMYLTNIGDSIYVLHVFEKKTAKTAKNDLDTARKRLNEIKPTGGRNRRGAKT